MAPPDPNGTGRPSDANRLVQALNNLGDKHLAIVTGAGISVASGIPTFRGDDPEAVWKNDVLEKGTYSYFRSNPVESRLWSQKLFEKILDAKPNPAHFGVARLHRRHTEAGGRATTLTQNIDSLHEAAGSDDLIKVHGTADRLRCASDLGCLNAAPRGSILRSDVDFSPFQADPSRETLPKCPLCGDLLRGHVLWFDEFYADHEDYQWQRVQETILTMDLLLFVGTSFSVGVTDAFLQTAVARGIPIFLVDPGDSPSRQIVHLRGKAEEILPWVCDRLDA